MNHALVIGGTGMLTNVSLWLASKKYHISVVGRNPGKMDRMISRAIDQSLITPLLVDYRDDNQLSEKLRFAIQNNGQPDLVVAWIHSNAEYALHTVIQAISNQNFKLIHVLGSSANLKEMKTKINIPDGCQYHQVQLGFNIEENGLSRWLTHEEIANGVIDSIKSDKQLNIVGTVDPWKKRP
ncbi:short-chain dehydrogenase [Bacillus sp. T33-2]|uniref:short-chain dehydrogenase n=1 Tax=Bacillus sp. T33-2 TaxID=2054168 RepID=UPI000C75DF95|nr:short-chain dehydrogenase [Bacillus sp. T33-2]PLR95056.1 short-chain dehydrogenase [Bacillus sp. T33-2]